MEQSTSLIYQPDRVLAKEPGRMLRDSLGYLARGSDSVMFFQWRAAEAGAEMYHPAMVPHAGPDSRIFRGVSELGQAVQRLGEIAGSTLRAEVAVLWDAYSWWALENPRFTSADLRYLDAVRADHAALWRAGVLCDFAYPEGDLARYRLVFAPAAYLISDQGVSRLREFVAGGGHLVVSFFSGMVDSRLHVRPGGYPGALRDVLGIRIEEFGPLGTDAAVTLSTGERGTVWTERLRCAGAAAVTSYADGPLAGCPAITRNSFGAGIAWYVSTRLDEQARDLLTAQALAGAGAGPVIPGTPPGLEVVRRAGAGGRSWLFVLNHTDAASSVPVTGTELLSGGQLDGRLDVAPGGVAVVREAPGARRGAP